jgi:putative membrane protein
MQLSEGMKQFDEEGIQKLADAYNGDIKGLIERMKATVEASKQYQTFSGKAEDVEGSVQFIFRTEGIETEE